MIRYILKILTFRFLLVALLLTLIYSSFILYIIGEIIGVAAVFGVENPQDNSNNSIKIISVYSGNALLPVTGLLPRELLDNVSRVDGVVKAWGEITVPVLVNGSLLVLRGIDDGMEALGLVLAVDDLGDNYTICLVGRGLAHEMKLTTGDVIIVVSPFSGTSIALVVAGVVDVPPPYTWEVLTSYPVAASIRGHVGYSVLRIMYRPGELDYASLSKIIGVKGEHRIIMQQAVVIMSRTGTVIGDPHRLESYYIERLGIPYEIIGLTALTVDALFALILIVVGRLAVTLRLEEFRTLVILGASPADLKFTVFITTLPLVLTGSVLGALLSDAYPSSLLAGYMVEPVINFEVLSVHSIIYGVMLGYGIKTARL